MLDLLLKSLAYASCIGIGAAAITLIYTSTRTFNFAHASMVAWGFYVVFALSSLTGVSPYYFIPLAALFSGFLGVLIYLLVNRRLLKAGASEITLMMSTLGLDLIFFGFLNIFSDYLVNKHRLPAKFFVLETREVYIGGVRLMGVVAPLLLLVTIALLGYILYKTRVGLTLRAITENQPLALLCGVNPEPVFLFAWFLGGSLAGLTGGMLSLLVTGYTAVGFTLIVTFFAGAIVGGLYSVYGSMLGGLLVGLGEHLGITALGIALGGWVYAYRPVLPLALIAVTLLVQPRGLAVMFEKLRARG